MPGRSPPRADPALAPVAALLAEGEFGPARALLLPVLQRRGDAGDAACALAATLLHAEPFRPDALACALDRLVGVIEMQDAHIRALRAMLEDAL